MAVVNPLPKEKAPPELQETYEGMTNSAGCEILRCAQDDNGDGDAAPYLGSNEEG